MGFSLSWVAVRGKSPDEVLDRVGYRRTGRQEEVAESSVTCGQLRTGWFVVLFNHDASAASHVNAAELSRGAEVVTCAVEEHVMVSEFAHWIDGERALAVDHNSETDSRHLDVRGTPTPEQQQIIDELRRKQAEADAGEGGVDYVFDVPVDLAQRLTGMRHDFDVQGGTANVDILERVPPAAKQASAPAPTPPAPPAPPPATRSAEPKQIPWWRILLGR